MKTKTKPSESSNILRFAGLFSGVGGLELGLSKAGHTSDLMCEIDPVAQEVLREKFPGHTLVGDIRKLKTLPTGTNALCAGFPCQDLSSVGQKAGITGDRSSLVGEVFRLLKNNPVEWVVIENVKFMLHLNKGDAVTQITSSLEKLGYNWCYRVVNSQGFGVPHRRHRVFFVASKNHDPRNVLLSQDATVVENDISKYPKKPLGFYWTEGAYSVGLAVDAVPPLKGGSTIGIPSPPAILFPNGHTGTPDIRDAERLQGFPIDWTLPAETAGRKSARWKLVGNAVTVNVAEWLGGKLISPVEYDSSRDLPLNDEKWPNAAWCMKGGKRHRSNASEFPINSSNPGLIEFLQYPTKPLSVKATAGFLSRAEKGSLSHAPAFLTALRKHHDKQKKVLVT